ncbi:MAG: anthranilate synthase component I [Dehalococcoidia bacterium]|nr:anthranilate synthase component I [Dehalococcoidia bacterium]
MYWPDKEHFKSLEEKGTLVPVYRELPADLETPVSVFLKISGKAPCFLLESVEKGERLGRYSFIGMNPLLTFETRGRESVLSGDIESRLPLRVGEDPLHQLQSLLSRYTVAAQPGTPRLFGGAVGYLSYDMVRYFETLPAPGRDELCLPECAFLLTDTLVIFDHVQQTMKVVSHARGGSPSAYQEARDKIEAIIASLNKALEVEPLGSAPTVEKGITSGLASNMTATEFKERVLVAKEYIAAGDAFQVVLSQRLRRQTEARPFSIYRTLRMINPSPYMFYLDFGGFQLIGSSPEMLVKLEDGTAFTRPIAGTRPRGDSDEEDKALSSELLADPKERAEHIMLVDLGRNDLGRVCRPGSVKVPLLMEIEKYSHVLHIVSSVEGKLRAGEDAFSLLRAGFPAGTVTGAPKIRAMEIINELEQLKRGPYAGAVGHFSFNGNMDTCITIRTIIKVGNTVYYQGGAGIVADSVPQREYEESLKKIEVLENAVRLAETRVESRVKQA